MITRLGDIHFVRLPGDVLRGGSHQAIEIGGFHLVVIESGEYSDAPMGKLLRNVRSTAPELDDAYVTAFEKHIALSSEEALTFLPQDVVADTKEANFHLVSMARRNQSSLVASTGYGWNTSVEGTVCARPAMR